MLTNLAEVDHYASFNVQRSRYEVNLVPGIKYESISAKTDTENRSHAVKLFLTNLHIHLAQKQLKHWPKCTSSAHPFTVNNLQINSDGTHIHKTHSHNDKEVLQFLYT